MSKYAKFKEQVERDEILSRLVPDSQKDDSGFTTDSHRAVIDGEVADFVLANYQYPRQRPINERQRLGYVLSMRTGDFYKGSAADMAFCEEDGRFYLLNGYHRFGAIQEARLPIEMSLTMHIVPTKDEMYHLYNTFDKGKVRDLADSARSEGIMEEMGLKLTQNREIKTLIAAVKTIMHGFEGRYDKQTSALNKEQYILPSVQEWATERQAYMDAINGGESDIVKSLLTAPYWSVGMVTFRYSPERAQEFWHEVAHNETGLKSGMPQYTLRRYAQEARPKKDSASDIAKKVASTFNAFFEGKELQKAVTYDNGSIAIEGTPYTKQHAVYYLPAKAPLEMLGRDKIFVNHVVLTKAHPEGVLITAKEIVTDQEVVRTYLALDAKSRAKTGRDLGTALKGTRDIKTAMGLVPDQHLLNLLWDDEVKAKAFAAAEAEANKPARKSRTVAGTGTSTGRASKRAVTASADDGEGSTGSARRGRGRPRKNMAVDNMIAQSNGNGVHDDSNSVMSEAADGTINYTPISETRHASEQVAEHAVEQAA